MFGKIGKILAVLFCVILAFGGVCEAESIPLRMVSFHGLNIGIPQYSEQMVGDYEKDNIYIRAYKTNVPYIPYMYISATYMSEDVPYDYTVEDIRGRTDGDKFFLDIAGVVDRSCGVVIRHSKRMSYLDHHDVTCAFCMSAVMRGDEYYTVIHLFYCYHRVLYMVNILWCEPEDMDAVEATKLFMHTWGDISQTASFE